jgi:septal ring factor EnvC (AmiA/AmiB activator)
MSDDRVTELEVRVADLERELKLRDDRTKELRTELDEATELVGQMRAARYRARKKAIDALPAKIAELRKAGEALIKAAKGLGRTN